MNPIALALPDLDGIEPGFTIRTGAEASKTFAERLAKAGVLQPQHWQGDPLEACRVALREYMAAVRPMQFSRAAAMTLAFTDFLELGEADGYLWHNQIRKSIGRSRIQITEAHEPVGGFMVCLDHVMDDGPHHQVIGPVLEALECCRPRLGQTVLAALEAGLARSCRGLTPRIGLDWASNFYWRGEEDESSYIEDELPELQDHYDHMSAEDKAKHGPPTAKDVDVLKRADYVACYPKWATSLGETLKPDALRRLRLPKKWRGIQAAAAALLERLAQRLDCTDDIGRFEETAWETCPYLFRWSDNGNVDPIGQIWDDAMQDHSQNGVIEMNVNGVFAFHNETTFRRALVRLRNWLEILALTETLIAALATDNKYIL